MGGSQSSCLGKPRCKEDEAEREPRHYVSRKIRPSDEDRGSWVGEPDVDWKASAFIAKFHESRFMDLQTHETRFMDHERQTVAV